MSAISDSTAAELRLEHCARHFSGRGDVHVFENQRLDLSLCHVDRGAVGAARAGSIGRDLRFCRVEQTLDDRGHEIAAVEWVGIDPVANEIGLHCRIHHLGEFAAAEEASPLRPDFGAQPLHQLLFCRQQPVFARQIGRKLRGYRSRRR
jgi:hypothetical protein